MEKFLCTHCGQRFESEPKEALLCPNCYWSTSVTKEEAPRAATVVVDTKRENIDSVSRRGRTPPWFAGGGVLFILLLLGSGFLALHHLKKQEDILQKIKLKNEATIATQAPELTLTAGEQAILDRVISLDPSRPVTKGEKEILAPRFPFRSLPPRGIPTTPWTEKEFDEFLKAQEAHYKLPFEWSYRRKLKQLFRAHYLAASQAFEAKDFLKARDEWIRALAFPVYHNDLVRHRGVALTMLRPYINDTLSKIGAMNTSLTGNDLYASETEIETGYEGLQELIAKGAWEEANARVLELEGQLHKVQQLPRSVTTPPLPTEVSLVDQDIRDVLLAQAAPVQPSSPDWESLRQDLSLKTKVIQSHVPSTLQEVVKQYETAVLHIKSKSWHEAKSELQRIDFPEELAEDARAKIEVIKKLEALSLDSQGETR